MPVSRTVIVELWKRLQNHDAPALSSEIAFHAILSIFPWFVILGSLSAWITGSGGDLTGPLAEQTLRNLPPGAVHLLQEISQEIASRPQGGLLSLALLISLWSASNVVQVLTKALNRAFEVRRTRLLFFRSRLVSMAVVVGSGLGLAALSGALVLVPRLVQQFRVGLDSGPIMTAVFSYLYLPASFGGIALILFVLYVVLPGRRPSLRWLAWGAMGSALSWILASRLFAWFVIRAVPFEKVYGSLGAMLFLMVFAYLSGLIILAGAEWAAILDHKKKKH